jgi:hypothetical protein
VGAGIFADRACAFRIRHAEKRAMHFEFPVRSLSTRGRTRDRLKAAEIMRKEPHGRQLRRTDNIGRELNIKIKVIGPHLQAGFPARRATLRYDQR